MAEAYHTPSTRQTNGRIPYLMRQRDRQGEWAYYVRFKRQPKVRIRAKPGTQRFWVAYWSALDGAGRSDGVSHWAKQKFNVRQGKSRTVTLKGASRMLGISTAQLRELAERGRAPSATQSGRSWLFELDQMLSWDWRQSMAAMRPMIDELVEQFCAVPSDTRVYFIQYAHENAVKIGWSRNPARRVARLQTWSPQVLRLIGQIPGGEPLEQAIHKHLDRHRLVSEWFILNSEVKSFMQEAIARHGVR